MWRLHCLFLPRRWQYPCLCARPGNCRPLMYSWCCWIDVLIPTLLQFSILVLMLSHYAKRRAGVRITDGDALLFGLNCVSREKEVALALLVLAHKKGSRVLHQVAICSVLVKKSISLNIFFIDCLTLSITDKPLLLYAIHVLFSIFLSVYFRLVCAIRLWALLIGSACLLWRRHLACTDRRVLFVRRARYFINFLLALGPLEVHFNCPVLVKPVHLRKHKRRVLDLFPLAALIFLNSWAGLCHPYLHAHFIQMLE